MVEAEGKDNIIDFNNDEIRQNGMDMHAANLLLDRQDKLNKHKVAKDSYKTGEAQQAQANRRGKKDLSVPVRLYIQGRNLKNLDQLSKSDPCCIVTELA